MWRGATSASQLKIEILLDTDRQPSKQRVSQVSSHAKVVEYHLFMP